MICERGRSDLCMLNLRQRTKLVNKEFFSCDCQISEGTVQHVFFVSFDKVCICLHLFLWYFLRLGKACAASSPGGSTRSVFRSYGTGKSRIRHSQLLGSNAQPWSWFCLRSFSSVNPSSKICEDMEFCHCKMVEGGVVVERIWRGRNLETRIVPLNFGTL